MPFKKMALSAMLLGCVCFPGLLQAESSPLGSMQPCMAEEFRQFDFWIGSWDVRNYQRNPGAPTDANRYPTGDATTRVYPVAGGCGIAEHWEGQLVWGKIRAYSLRAWDPELKHWQLVLLWPAQGSEGASFSTLTGDFEHGRGEFFAPITNPEAPVTRFTFSDIGSDSFRWEQDFSQDGQMSWANTWHMEMTRRDPLSAAPLYNGPGIYSPEDPQCIGENVRSLDALQGMWRAGNSSMQVVPITGGCAQMFNINIAGDEPRQVTGSRAWDPILKRWVAWILDDQGMPLRRLEGKVKGQKLVLKTDDDRPALRQTWSWEEGAVQWKLEEKDGGKWKVLGEQDFSR